MREMEGIGQRVISYDHGDHDACCGMTFFQCGSSPVVILSDLGRGVSITNSIESAASHCRAMYFLHIHPKDILFFEHYHRENGKNDFFAVTLYWDGLKEKYDGPEFKQVNEDHVYLLLACSGYTKKDIPSLTFPLAKVMSFPSRS